MALLDIIILIIIIGFTLYGFSAGFVHAVTSLAGTILALIIAVHTYVPVTQWVLPEGLASMFVVQMIVFALILALVGQLVGILVRVIGRVFDVISIVPFTKTLNRLLGTIFGGLQGILAVAGLLFAATLLPTMPTAFQAAIDASLVAPWVMFVVNLLIILFPDAIDRVRNAVGI